jgi:hypothetical protein
VNGFFIEPGGTEAFFLRGGVDSSVLGQASVDAAGKPLGADPKTVIYRSNDNINPVMILPNGVMGASK